ncbi:MAG: Plug and carboxypeptidase regulatory-like domain-containing protein [Acidobacteriota bacterium]|nr:Plug and carboxypeptidase regulatory-like domain-containing protein [Acidobacteriota bacterium]
MKRLLITIASCILAAAPARGQVDIGQISGTAVDNTKAVVPSVKVTVTNEGSQLTRETVTNNSGYYTFPNLMVGTYTVSAQAKGFAKYIRTAIVVNAAAQLDIAIPLTLGTLAETVQVTESAGQALSLEPSTGGTVTSEQFQQLEVNGRNPVYLALLEPGVVGSNIATFDPDSVSNGGFSMNGGRTDAYTVYVDGAMATRTRESGSMLGAQDMNTVQEIQVLTGNFDAEYGRSNAGQIRFVTKSGTTKFHGDAYEVLRNAAFDANSWSRNESPISRQNSKPPKQNYNDFGFDLGGPVFVPGKFNTNRSKLFFFVAEEWIRRRYDDDTTGTAPTAAMRTGDLSALLNPHNSFFGKTRIVTDPTTGKPFAGNIIPSSRLSQQGIALLNAYPLPTPGFQRGSANWIQTFPVFSNVEKTTFKVDYYLNDKNHLYVRGTLIPWHFDNPLEGTLGLFESLWSRPNRTGIVDLTTSFSPTLLNDFSVSANSDGKGSIDENPACGAYCQRGTYGITYPYLYPGTKLFPQKLPTMAITGLTTVDTGPYPGFWSGFVEDYTDNVTKIKGNHTLMFGATFEHAGQNDLIQLTTASPPQTNNQNGAFQFLDTGMANTSGLGIANALLGNFNNYSEFGTKPETPWAANSLDIFAQDVWQVTPKLNLHYGLRYSIWPSWGSTNGTIAQFEPQFYNPAQAAAVSPTTGFITSGSPYNGIVLPGSGPTQDGLRRYPFLNQPPFSGMYHNLPAGFAPTQWNLFQPRLGLAYQIASKTVLRAGIGYYADRTAINRDTALGGNPPFMPQTTLVNGNLSSLGSAGSITVPFTMTINAPNNVWPTAWEYNTTVQHQFGRGVDVSAGYVGNRGLHLQRKRNINQIEQPGTIYQHPQVNPNALRPYLGAGIIDMSENSGSSWYNSLQVTGSKTSGPLTFSASYTLSRSMDNTSILTDVLPNAYDDRNYWGPSDFNVPQALTFSYVYKLPLRGRRTLAGAVLGDWTLSGVNQFQAGTPFSVRQNIDYAGIGPGSGNQFWNVTGDPSGCSTSFIPNVGATRYCASAFAAPGLGTFANRDSRNTFNNPGFWEWNLALHKQFPIPISEASNIEFRAEAFNVLNHPNWGPVNNNPVSSAFMMVTTKTDNRNLQFELKLSF